MSDDINDFISTEDKPEKVDKPISEQPAEPVQQEQPAQPPVQQTVQASSNGDNLSSFQKTELNNLATTYKVDLSYVEKHFSETWNTPIFKTVKDPARKFRMVKRDVENHLEDLAELIQTTFFVFGKYTSYIPGDWNNVASSLVGLLTVSGGPPKLINVTSWEDPGSKIYVNLNDAVPLHSYKIYLDQKEDKKTKKKTLGLSVNTKFKHGVSPIDSNPAKYGKMTSIDLLKKFAGVSVYDSVDESGLSRKPGGGRADPTDLKAVRVLCTTFSRRFKAKDSDFPNMYQMQSDGTDFEGAKVILRFPPFSEYEIFKQEIAEKQGFSGIAVGPVSEYEGKTYIDVYYWISTE